MKIVTLLFESFISFKSSFFKLQIVQIGFVTKLVLHLQFGHIHFSVISSSFFICLLFSIELIFLLFSIEFIFLLFSVEFIFLLFSIEFSFLLFSIEFSFLLFSIFSFSFTIFFSFSFLFSISLLFFLIIISYKSLFFELQIPQIGFVTKLVLQLHTGHIHFSVISSFFFLSL